MTNIAEDSSDWEVPTRRVAAWFQLRVWAHVLWRSVSDLYRPAVRRHCVSDLLKDEPVVAERRSALWHDARGAEFVLVAGKVHNLRLARGAFDGVVVQAGEVFSFWRQLGRPGRWRGFVQGREIRSGCVVPTVAGGLCQLSNALAACASSAGFRLVERHGHTARIVHDESRDAADTADATVFWNYVDLRFVADVDFRVEVALTHDELVVRIRSAGVVRSVAARVATHIPIAAGRSEAPAARGCLSCDQTGCFRHRPPPTGPSGAPTAVLVDAWTPELASHLEHQAVKADWFIPWVRSSRRAAGGWTPPPASLHTLAVLASWRRMLRLRRRAGEGGGRQAAVLECDRWLAQRYARALEPRHVHLFIDQSLLVPLAQAGVLGGRTYDVFVHALPAGELHRRLDAAANHRPEAASLRDFRASDVHCSIEAGTLRHARCLVTPHADVAGHLRTEFPSARVESLDWCVPPLRGGQGRRMSVERPVVAFAASALARKGAHEMAAAVRHLGWRLLVLGTPSSDPSLWQGIEVAHVNYRDTAWLRQADVVALPAFVEHAPRALLAAIAHGLPVVASRQCGLPPSLGAIDAPAGDVPGLVRALEHALDSARRADVPNPGHGQAADARFSTWCNRT